ncbi:MAG: hypothetical protein ABIQ59_08150 [Nocardioidaceae bacterium]
MTQPPPPPGWVPPGPPQGGGYGPSNGPSYGQVYGPAVHKPGVVALRPLGLGDFFDGAFKTIRRNPWAMVGLAALVSTAFMVVPVVITLSLAAAGRLSVDFGLDATSGSAGSFDVGAITLATYLGPFFGLFATVVLNGMLVRVVAEAVLGRRTTVGEAWAATRGRLFRLAGLMLLDFVVVVLLLGVPFGLGLVVGARSGLGAGLAVGVPLGLLGIAAVAFVQVRYFQLAAPALVLERTGVFASLRRAGRLSRGQFWRIFGILLLTALVAGIVGQVISVPLALVGTLGPLVFPGTGGALLLVLSSYLSQIVVGALTTPFTSAVTALQYVDQRIRKEGLDVELIAASQRGPTGTR